MGRTKLLVWFFLMLLVPTISACKQGEVPQVSEPAPVNTQIAPWLQKIIQELEQQDPTNPPAKIYRYTYNNQQVYYLTGRCCDVPSKLYDKNGNLICEPDGGITGRGDGRCPDFFEKRQNETLIWEDKRES